MEKHCENCKYAEQTDIDGLIDCKKDGHSKDCDMVCEQFAKQDKGNVLDWLNEIISDPENWHRWYSDSEVKLLAEYAKRMIEESV